MGSQQLEAKSQDRAAVRLGPGTDLTSKVSRTGPGKAGVSADPRAAAWSQGGQWPKPAGLIGPVLGVLKTREGGSDRGVPGWEGAPHRVSGALQLW